MGSPEGGAVPPMIGYDATEHASAVKKAWKQLDMKTRRRIARLSVKGETGATPWEAQWVVAYSTRRLNSRWEQPYVAIPLLFVLFIAFSVLVNLVAGWNVSGGAGALIGYSWVIIHQQKKMRQAIELNSPGAWGPVSAPPAGYAPPGPSGPTHSGPYPPSSPDTWRPSSGE